MQASLMPRAQNSLSEATPWELANMSWQKFSPRSLTETSSNRVALEELLLPLLSSARFPHQPETLAWNSVADEMRYVPLSGMASDS